MTAVKPDVEGFDGAVALNKFQQRFLFSAAAPFLQKGCHPGQMQC